MIWGKQKFLKIGKTQIIKENVFCLSLSQLLSADSKPVMGEGLHIWRSGGVSPMESVRTHRICLDQVHSFGLGHWT